MNDTLTPEEISALEREATSTGYDMKAEEVLRRDAVSYDLLSVENAVAGVIPTVETIMERLGNVFRARLSKDLRKEVDISVCPVDVGAYTEVVGDSEKQCEVSVFEVSPLQGRMLLVVERKLTFSLVDAYFGGSGTSYIERMRSDYTATELRMNKRIRDHAISAMEVAWSPFCVTKTREVARETNPKHLAQFDTSEQYVVGSMKIKVGEAGGTVRIAYESVAFEPIRTRIRRREGVRRTANSQSLENLNRLGLQETGLDVAVILGEKVFSMREMLALRKGDFIPLDIKEVATVRCEDVDLFVGKVGEADGWNALELSGFDGVDVKGEGATRASFRKEKVEQADE